MSSPNPNAMANLKGEGGSEVGQNNNGLSTKRKVELDKAEPAAKRTKTNDSEHPPLSSDDKSPAAESGGHRSSPELEVPTSTKGEEKKTNADVLMMLSEQASMKAVQSNQKHDDNPNAPQQGTVGQFQVVPAPTFVGPTNHNTGGFTTQYTPSSGLGGNIQNTLFTNPDGSMVPVQIIPGPNGQALLVQQISLPQAAQAQMQSGQQMQMQMQSAQQQQLQQPIVDVPSNDTDSSAYQSSAYQSNSSSTGSSDPGNDAQRQIFKRERNRLHARKSRERKKKTFAALHGRAAQLTGLITLLLEAAIKYVPQDLCAMCVEKCQAMEIKRWTEPSPHEKLKPR